MQVCGPVAMAKMHRPERYFAFSEVYFGELEDRRNAWMGATVTEPGSTLPYDKLA